MKNLELLIQHGADASKIFDRLSQGEIAENLDIVLKYAPEWLRDADHLCVYEIPVGRFLYELKLRGAPIDILTRILNSDDTDDDGISLLIEHGINIESIFNAAPEYLKGNTSFFLKYGASYNILCEFMSYYEINRNLDSLLEHGIDVDDILKRTSFHRLADDHLDLLLEYGADIDLLLREHMSLIGVEKNLSTLLEKGADIETVVINTTRQAVVDNFALLIEYGAEADVLIQRLRGANLDSGSFQALLKQGADVRILARYCRGLNRKLVANNSLILKKYINPDIIDLIIAPKKIEKFLSQSTGNVTDINFLVNVYINSLEDFFYLTPLLLEHGADAELLARNMIEPYQVAKNFNLLLRYGVDIDTLVTRIGYGFNDSACLEYLLKQQVDPDIILRHAKIETIVYNADKMLKYGVDIDKIITAINV